MAEHQRRRFGRREVSAHYFPCGERRQHRDGANEPGAEHGSELDADERAGAVRQLHQQPQRAGLLLLAQRPDGDKWKLQRHRDIEGSEGGNQNAVQRRKAGGKNGGLRRRGAGLAIERNRLKEAVADQRTTQQQHRPQGAPAHDRAQLLCEQRPQRSAAGR